MQEYELEQQGMEGTVPFKSPVWWNYSISVRVHHSYLNAAEKSVYMTLHSFLSHDGSTCFPSVKTLAEATSFSRATVFRVLKSLSEKKLIARHQQFDEKCGRQKPTSYEIFQIPDELLYVNRKNEPGYKAESHSETGMKYAVEGGGSHVETGGVPNSDEAESHSETGAKCAFEGHGGSRIETGGVSRRDGGGSHCETPDHYHNDHLSKDLLEDTALRADAQSQAESENQEKSEKQEIGISAFAETVSHSLKPIIEHFLTITGRKTLKPQELKVLEALSGYSEEQIHQEISIAVGRFRRMNRLLHSLLLNYIVGSLSKKNKKTLPQCDVNPLDVIDVSGWEYADTRKYNKNEVKEFYETGGWGNFEELKTLCEICRLSECEISELYEELRVPAMMSA